MASIYKRGKIYWGRIERNHRLFRRSLKTTSKQEAERRLSEWKDELDAQQWGDRPRAKYSDVMMGFLQQHCPTLKPQSQRRYFVSARQLTPVFSGLYLDEITSARLAEFEQARRKDGASSPTIRRDLACLSSMFNYAMIDLELIDENPVPLFLKRQARRGRLKESAPRRRYLTHKEEDLLLKHCDGDLSLLVAFAIDTGLRLEEQLSLVWQAVDLSRNKLSVTGKGGKQREVPLMSRAAEVLASLPRYLRTDGTPDWVFCKRDGSRYHKRTRGLAGAVKRAKIDHIQWHDLRRTCGCRLLQDRGFTMQEVSLWLGHSSIKQTERTYAFLEIDQLQQRLETSNEIIRQKAEAAERDQA